MKNIALIFALLAGLLLAPFAHADTVTKKDGTVHEGEIVKETDSYLYIRVDFGGIEKDYLVLKDEIESLERSEKMMDAKDEKRSAKQAEKPVFRDGVERIAFISLEDTVGMYMNAKALSNSVEIPKELPENEQPTIVVLVINSGGGALFEIQPLMDVITDEIRPHYRTTAWIKSAISAAAMTGWVVPEIYFQTKGNFGACTGFFGASGVQMDGLGLQQVLHQMEEASLNSGYDPYIMRAMQISGPDYPTILSADIDEHGNVIWYLQEDPDEPVKGEYLVSKHDEILTFDSRQAEFFKFSKGTADTKAELAKLMGCEEWVEVGQEADEYMVGFRERVRDAENRTTEIQRQLNAALANASSGRGDCARWVGKARRLVGEMRATVRGTSLGRYTQYNDEWFEFMDEAIRDIQEACNEATKSSSNRNRR